MKFNPFRPNNITSPGMFSGRLDELRTLERCMYQTKFGNPQHFLLEGERGIGKTSLLYYATLIARGDLEFLDGVTKVSFLVVSIDANGLTVQAELVQRIARMLKAEIGKRQKIMESAKAVWDFLTGWEVLGVRFHKDAQNYDPDELNEQLVEAFSKLLQAKDTGIDGIMLLLDEADSPDPNVNLGAFLKLFTERLARDGCERVLVGLAGLPTTIAKLRASHESSPRLLEIVHLEPLTNPERHRVVEMGLAEALKHGTEMKITADAMNEIANLSEGYPHFIQQFSYSAFDADNDGEIDLFDVQLSAYRDEGALMQLGSKYFSEMYHTRIASEGYRDVLGAIAKHGDAWVEKKTIIKESGVNETRVTNALAALKARGIILTDDAKRGFYRLPTRSFATWINAIRAKKGGGGLATGLLGDG